MTELKSYSIATCETWYQACGGHLHSMKTAEQACSDETRYIIRLAAVHRQALIQTLVSPTEHVALQYEFILCEGTMKIQACAVVGTTDVSTGAQ